jgi:hypothetical protein
MSEVSLSYESRLDQDLRWAMSEGERFFDEKSETHETLRRICKRLNELNIPYSVVGGMALFKHGFRRFTEDVDILVTKEDLKKIHENLTGLGYTPLFERSKNLRDTQSGVRIEFLLTGNYPGDGKAKPVAFPDPSDVSEMLDEVSYVKLPTLIELKLASGMSGADRMRDLADVQELIRLLSLPPDFSTKLNEYVRPKYEELWQNLYGAKRRYLQLIQLDAQTSDVDSLDELISQSGDPDGVFSRMKDAGVIFERHPSRNDLAFLVTTDPEIANQFDMHEESEFFGLDEGHEDA